MTRDFLRNQTRWFPKSILFLDFLFTRRFEFRSLGSVDRVIHVSEGDLKEFDSEIRKKSVVIPNTLPYSWSSKGKTTPKTP